MGGTLEQWMSEYTPKKVDVPICFDAELVERLNEAELVLAAHQSEKTLSDKVRDRLTKERDDLAKEHEDRTHMFTFQSLGGGQWREILSKHPPTSEQRLKHGKELEYNPETFPIAVMAAANIHPGLTEDQTRTLMDRLNAVDQQRLWNACYEVCVSGVELPKGISTVSRRAGEKRSTLQSA